MVCQMHARKFDKNVIVVSNVNKDAIEQVARIVMMMFSIGDKMNEKHYHQLFDIEPWSVDQNVYLICFRYVSAFRYSSDSHSESGSNSGSLPPEYHFQSISGTPANQTCLIKCFTAIKFRIDEITFSWQKVCTNTSSSPVFRQDWNWIVLKWNCGIRFTIETHSCRWLLAKWKWNNFWGINVYARICSKTEDGLSVPWLLGPVS